MTGKTKIMRSPLGRVRGLGSAHAGTHHWWMQRLTSLALIPLSIWFIVTFLCHALSGDYAETIHWLRNPFAATAMILLIGVGCYHAAGGLQVVLEDYVHTDSHDGWRFFWIIVTKFVAAALALLGSLTTAKILFGV